MHGSKMGARRRQLLVAATKRRQRVSRQKGEFWYIKVFLEFFFLLLQLFSFFSTEGFLDFFSFFNLIQFWETLFRLFLTDFLTNGQKNFLKSEKQQFQTEPSLIKTAWIGSIRERSYWISQLLSLINYILQLFDDTCSRG